MATYPDCFNFCLLSVDIFTHVSWSTTQVKEFNKLNLKLKMEIKTYKNYLVFIVLIYAQIYRKNYDELQNILHD